MNNATLKCFRVLEPTSEQRLLYGILYAILTTTSLSVNVLLICIVALQRVRIRGIVVYKLTSSLNVSSMIYVLCNYPLMLPCTFQECFYYTDISMIVLGTMNTLGYYTSFWTNFYIIVERISLFLYKPLHELIEKYIALFVMAPWGVGLFITGTTLGVGCYKRFNTYTHTYTFGCAKCVLGKSFSITEFLFWASQAFSLIMFIGYAAIMIKFKFFLQKTAQHRRGRKDMKLVIQFLVICTFQWFSCFFFYMVPFVFGTSFQGSLALNISGIGNTMVNPIVLLIFNKVVRDGFLNVIGVKKLETEVVVTVMQQTRICHTAHLIHQRASTMRRLKFSNDTVVPSSKIVSSKHSSG